MRPLWAVLEARYFSDVRLHELTGLIGAAALMRPSKSIQDMELKSLKEKYKDRKFAAGCSREIIFKGAELLGWDLDQLQNQTLQAMRAKEQEANQICSQF